MFDYTNVKVEWVQDRLALVFCSELDCLDFIKSHEGLHEKDMFCANGHYNAVWLPVWRNTNG